MEWCGPGWIYCHKAQSILLAFMRGIGSAAYAYSWTLCLCQRWPVSLATCSRSRACFKCHNVP